jgi:hypothetical protein
VKDIEKELFKLFTNSNGNFELYKETLALIREHVIDEIGCENGRFYSVLSKISNSINNAGHEERRSKDISYIGDEQHKIVVKYEDYLP